MNSKLLENHENPTEEKFDYLKKPTLLLPSERIAVKKYSTTLVTKFTIEENYNIKNYYDLVNKIRLLLNKNQWLGQKIVKNSKNEYELDQKNYEAPGQDNFIVDHYFSLVYDPDFFANDSKSFDDLLNCPNFQNSIQKYVVSKARILAEKSENPTKITLIRNQENSCESTEFFLIISISNLLCDAATVYKLFSMLSNDQEIISLDPIRIDVSENVYENTGLAGEDMSDFAVVLKRSLAWPVFRKSFLRRGKISDDGNDLIFKKYVKINLTKLQQNSSKNMLLESSEYSVRN